LPHAFFDWLTFSSIWGYSLPRMRTNRQPTAPSSEPPFPYRPVFTLDAFTQHLNGRRDRARERVKYHVARGRLKVVARGVYAVVPPGRSPASYYPDRYLVAAAVRPDALLSHHAALELLGAAHSDWNVCTAFTARRRQPLQLNGVKVVFVPDPAPLARSERLRTSGTRSLDREGVTLRVTGPERTLLDGFRQPRLTGGLGELVESAAGFGVLDLDLLLDLLALYGHRVLWAAAGWFLERFHERFFVDDRYLRKLESHRPKSKHYLPRGSRRGGVLVPRWNLVLPTSVVRPGEPGAAE